MPVYFIVIPARTNVINAIELFITTELLFVLLRATKLMSLIKPTALDFS
nr:MAG TPA: hypothetical protein [Caudoviricetes sp.]